MPEEMSKPEHTTKGPQGRIGQDSRPYPLDIESHRGQQGLMPIGSFGRGALEETRDPSQRRFDRAISVMKGHRRLSQRGARASGQGWQTGQFLDQHRVGCHIARDLGAQALNPWVHRGTPSASILSPSETDADSTRTKSTGAPKSAIKSASAAK
jgi:hypothetical protein